MSKQKEANGIVALIDTPIIEGYEIKEWSIKQFSLLYPHLKIVTGHLQEQGATFDNLDAFVENNLMDLVDAIIPVLPDVLKISLRLTDAEVDEMSATQASVLGIAILKKNVEHLTSFLARIQGS